MHRRALLLFALPAVGLIGCGEPLQAPDYLGDPLAAFAVIPHQPHGSPDAPPASLRATVLWSVDGVGPVQQPDLAVPVVEGADVRVVLHRPPPTEARPAGHALGRIVFFEDVDGDGRVGPDEPVRTPPRETTLAWSAAGLTPAEAPISLPLPAGYARVDGYLPCGGPYRSSGETACAAPLGAPCETDGDCGVEGVCLRDLEEQDTGGFCATRAGPDDACPPRGARRVPAFQPPEGFVWIWARACTADRDCPTGLACAHGSGVCAVRYEPLRVQLGPAGETGEICVDDRISRREPSPGPGSGGQPPPMMDAP